MSPGIPKIAFAGGTLDRAAEARNDGRADRLRTDHRSSAVLVGDGQDVAIDGDGGPLARVPVAHLPADAELTFLGLEPSGAAVFAFDARAPWFDAPAGTGFVPLRTLAGELDPDDAALAAYAVGMVGWHRVQRFCGRCGSATEVEAAGHRRRCPVCGLLHFPRTDPAITMLVQLGDRCLLSRRRGAPEHRWSALAGFVEPGETPEEAVVREAREETGVEVVAVEYVTAQPWPFPQALMIGYWAFADPPPGGSDLTPDQEELVEARWWRRDELAAALRDDVIALPPPGTIGNYLISTWLARC
ncbi:MAG: NAD(+) diphosphatase [Solirubrobacterales bacterium]|nr:NAD(+) diphosphatase [Solirubrobacterales bacterium]